MLVARGLGPVQYGNMMFLLGTFTAIRGLLDIGSSTAFFTFLSQRPRSNRFVRWFAIWLGVQFFVPLLLVGLVFPEIWVQSIWKGQDRSLVVMAFLTAYLQSTLWSVVIQMGESQRLTRTVQAVGSVIVALHLLLVVVLWWQQWLSIRLIFAAMILEWAVGAWVIARQLHFASQADDNETFVSILKEFWHYCLPMIPYCWFAFAYEFADRWLLQNYGGSVHQAYYSVAFQFGAIAAIATSSIVSVFWKEIAEAHQQGKLDRVASLYRRASRGLFFVAASVAGFLAPWSEEILYVTLGPSYVGGATALTIMFLYPIHQSMGQIGATMLYATGRVRAQVVMGIISMAISMIATYFVLAPRGIPIAGLALGAAGLAGKMVAMQFLSVNLVAYYLSKKLEITFDWLYQPAVLLWCLGSGWLVYSVFNHQMATIDWVLLQIVAASILYLLMIIMMVWFQPSLVGFSRQEIMDAIKHISKVSHRRMEL